MSKPAVGDKRKDRTYLEEELSAELKEGSKKLQKTESTASVFPPNRERQSSQEDEDFSIHSSQDVIGLPEDFDLPTTFSPEDNQEEYIHSPKRSPSPTKFSEAKINQNNHLK